MSDNKIRAALTIIILNLCFPISFLLVIFANIYRSMLLLNFFGSKMKKGMEEIYEHQSSNKKGKVLVTGGKMTKSLYIVRWLGRIGYEVVLVETPSYRINGTRFSKYTKSFYIVKDPRIHGEDAYVQDLVRIAKKERCTFFLPVSSPAAARADAQAHKALATINCQSLHFDSDTCDMLDNKHTFCRHLKNIGLRHPKSFQVNCDDDVRTLNQHLLEEKSGSTYILKNLEYDAIHRLNLFKLPTASTEKLDAYLSQLKDDNTPISSAKPWQVQQYLSGAEFCAMAVLRRGQITAYACSPSGPSLLNYTHTNERNDILQWIQSFAAKHPTISGQVCWDFIVNPADNLAYPIEANPRLHTQSCLFASRPEFGFALVHPTLSTHTKISLPFIPDRKQPEIYWLFNELAKFIAPKFYGPLEERLPLFPFLLDLFFNKKEAVFDLDDPFPFLITNHLQIPIRLLATLLHGRSWKKVDFAIGKVVELNGD